MLNFIVWDIAPEIFSLGSLSVRWYGLLFASGFLIGQQILIKIYKQEGLSEKYVETLTLYMVLATVIGARLGHCLFYEPEYFLAHPIEILYVWQGGLASHGATIGILFAIWLYSRKYPHQTYLYVLDRMVITIALAGCLIRLGNLMNSEIVGKPTDISTAFIFVNPTTESLKETYKGQITKIKVSTNGQDSTYNGTFVTGLDMRLTIKSMGSGQFDELAENGIRQAIYNSSEYGEHVLLPQGNILKSVGTTGPNGTELTVKVWGIPRHPSQLYESISCLILFVLLWLVYNHKKEKTPRGLIFGIFVVYIFGLRFFYEFLKENQVAFEDGMKYNMGQLLSIPMVIIGLIVLIRSLRKKPEVKA